MGAFEHSKKVEYKTKDKLLFLTELPARSQFWEELYNDDTQTFSYIIGEGETAPQISQDYYDDPELFWTIMYLNNYLNPFYDWPMSSNTLDAYANDKYDNPDAIEFWVVEGEERIFPTEQDAIDAGYTDALGISGYQYEEYLNAERRNIRLIVPDVMGMVLSRWEDEMKRR